MKTDRGHPPIANRVVCVDFDGTLVPWGPLMAKKDPFPKVVEWMNALRAAGYTIVIFTSRASETWWRSARPKSPEAFGKRQVEYVADILDRHGVPYDRITAEKVPAEAYFDDKARGVTDAYPLTYAIEDFLNGN